MSNLNVYRLTQARELLHWAGTVRTERLKRWQAVHAVLLDQAAEMRRTAWQQWDYTQLIWVCTCCLLVAANGECCADSEHGGDSMEPLSAIAETDSYAPGIGSDDHSKYCTPADREEGCDCDSRSFSQWQCGGCGSWLAGERHGMTLFVNDKRQHSYA